MFLLKKFHVPLKQHYMPLLLTTSKFASSVHTLYALAYHTILPGTKQIP